MLQIFSRLAIDEHGQDLIEYALLCAVLAVSCIFGMLQLSRIREFFAAAGLALDNAI